jgi:AraC-like DNA-binding protein
MGNEIAVKAFWEADYQDEGRYSAYVRKTFYQMNHLFRPITDKTSIKVQDFSAGKFVIADTHLRGEMRAVGERNWNHIRSDNTKLFVLWFPLEGSLNMVHNGKREVLKIDEFTMTLSSLPHRGTVELSHGEQYRCIMVTVPFSYITDILPHAQDLCGLKFDIDNAPLRMSLDILTALSDNPGQFDEETAHHFISSALYSVFSSIRSTHDGAIEALSIKDSRAKEVLSFIDRHLAESNLTAKKIGEGCSISSRYVHSLLRQRGTSLKDYVWRSRYDQARARIADPRYSHETIGNIAMDLGFRSNAHFSTGFRKVFGKSPSEVRLRALEAASKSIASGAKPNNRPCSQNL